MNIPDRKAILAARSRGGLFSVDPKALLYLIDSSDEAMHLVDDAMDLLRYSGDSKRNEWMERAEAHLRLCDEMEAV